MIYALFRSFQKDIFSVAFHLTGGLLCMISLLRVLWSMSVMLFSCLGTCRIIQEESNNIFCLKVQF